MILEKLAQLYSNNEPLVITSDEYQILCVEVFNLGDAAAQWDDLILNFVYQGQQVEIDDGNILSRPR